MRKDLLVFSKSQLEDLAEFAIVHGLAVGASDVVVKVEESEALSVSVRNAELDSFQHQRSKRLKITVWVGLHTGSSYTGDLSHDAIRRATEAACFIAKQTGRDSVSGIPAPDEYAKNIIDLNLLHPWEVSLAQAIEITKNLEGLALHVPDQINDFDLFPKYGKCNLSSNGSHLSTTHGQFLLASSNGFMHGYGYSSHSLWAQLVVTGESGMQGGQWWSSSRSPSRLADLAELARTAAHRTLRRIGARGVPSGNYPVIFEAPVASTLLQELFTAIAGSSQYREQSFLLNCVGEAIMAPHIDVIEDPLISQGLNSASFDAEGIETRRQYLVSGGVLETYLCDTYSARRLGCNSKGHAGGARNASLKSKLTTAVDDFASLLVEMGTGLLVTELLGGDVNPVTGGYSQGVAGFWVQNGVIRHAVEVATISGNLRQMFQGIIAVATDEPENSNLRTGSILIDNVRVGGN